jgi:hypothetical protein
LRRAAPPVSAEHGRDKVPDPLRDRARAVRDVPLPPSGHPARSPHAAQGLVAHLVDEGVTNGFVIGGDHGNEPE